MAIEVLPAFLLNKEAWSDFVAYLREVPIPARRKKEVIVEWAGFTGVALTREMVKEVLGVEADNI